MKNNISSYSNKIDECAKKFMSIHNYRAASNTIKNLFLNKNKNIILYGAGIHTQKIFECFNGNDLKNIVAIVDSNKPSGKFGEIKIIHPSEIKNFNFDYIVLSSDTNQARMLQELNNNSINTSNVIDIYKEDHFFEICNTNESVYINNIAAEINSSKKPLVIVGLAFQLNHILLFNELSQHYDLFVFSAIDRISNSVNIKNLHLDYKMLALESVIDIFSLTSKIVNGSILSLIGWRYNSFGACIIAYSKVKVFCMVIDILSSMFETVEDAMSLFGRDMESEWLCEKLCWLCSDGYIHKDHPKALNYLVENYGIRNSLHFLTYIDNIQSKINMYSKEKPKIVYAAGIHSLADNADCSYVYISLLSAVKTLTSQGYEFHIYNAYDNGTTGKWSDYWNEAETNKLFHYHKAVSPEILIKELEQYDVAMCVFDFQDNLTRQDYRQYCFSTRILAYIQAGLPIINSKEVEYLGQVIDDLAIGISIKFNELENMDNVIERLNIKKCLENMPKAQEAMSYKNNIHKLIDFIEKD